MTDPESSSITRRRSLQLIGGSGLLVAGAGSFGGRALAAISEGHDHVAHAAAACRLTPEQEEGPFYVAVGDVRSNLIAGQKGLPFKLVITVINSKTCKPLRNAGVDIWHCNSAGLYSDESSQSTLGETWLRGVQFTDKHGRVTFHTIYPGHYSGRTTHVHAKVHIGGNATHHKFGGGHVSHTGNLFSTDAINAEVYKLAPYLSDTDQIVPLTQDMVYRNQHGSGARMRVTRAGNRLSKGLIGHITLGVNPSSTPAAVGIGS